MSKLLQVQGAASADRQRQGAGNVSLRFYLFYLTIYVTVGPLIKE